MNNKAVVRIVVWTGKGGAHTPPAEVACSVWTPACGSPVEGVWVCPLELENCEENCGNYGCGN